MKKLTFIFAIIAILALTGVCSASPLMNYSKGKASIDLTIRPGYVNIFTSVGSSETKDADKNNFEGTITYGLGHNIALQYRNTTGNSETFPITVFGLTNNNARSTLNAQEFNILYKLNKNVAVYLGWVQAKVGQPAGEYNISTGIARLFDDYAKKNDYQVGLVGTKKLGPKLTGYASAATGKYITNYEIGIGYEVAKNVEFNLGYKNTKYKDFAVSNHGLLLFTYDYQIKGLAYGLTYKF